MKHETKRAKIPDKLDIKLACDADLNAAWKNAGMKKTPSDRFSLIAALVGGLTHLFSRDDHLPHSKN
jgi:hypothetical protein